MSTEQITALDAAIQELAVSGIAQVTIAGQTTTVKSIDELLRWRDRLVAAQAATKPHFGIRFSKIIPPGPG